MTTIQTISTFQTNLSGRKNISRLGGLMQKLGNELSTGLRSDVYADLGMRSAQSLDMRNRLDRTEAYKLSNTILAGKMDMTTEALRGMREAAQSFLNISAANMDAPSQTVAVLQDQARATLDLVIRAMNTSYGGEHLFSGLATDRAPMQALDTVNPATGLSPQDVVQGIAGTGPVDAADALARIAALQAVFSSAAVDPAQDFDATFYNGTPRLAPDSSPMGRVVVRLDDSQTLNVGIQANDPGFTDLLKGLMMIATVNPQDIPDAGAYAEWMGHAVTAISDGIGAIDAAQVGLGNQQALVDKTLKRQQVQMDLYNNGIAGIEAADPYDTAARLTALRTQLEATYSVTAQLSKLSFLNYM
ncbi:hypothetical protein EYC08_17510 [Tabrizicola sp. WMC-M-20]|nr:hypothetical protein EYC08_17510 [Tabrizicola sp. WMC-M-20]